MASVFLGEVRVIYVPWRWSSASNSYDCVWLYLIILYHYLLYNDVLDLLQKFHNTTRIIFSTFDTMYRYNVFWQS